MAARFAVCVGPCCRHHVFHMTLRGANFTKSFCFCHLSDNEQFIHSLNNEAIALDFPNEIVNRGSDDRVDGLSCIDPVFE